MLQLDKVGKDDGGGEMVDYTWQMQTWDGVFPSSFFFLFSRLTCNFGITAPLLLLITDNAIEYDLHLIVPYS